MSHYKHILLATDFSDYCTEIADKAKELVETNHAQLSIIHVVDNIPITDATYGPIIPYDGDITEQIIDAGKVRLAKMANQLNIPENKQWLEIGSPKYEIVRIADENNIDLIIVGSHGRHGFALLLGSVANGILHHAHCDVLAVRIKDD